MEIAIRSIILVLSFLFVIKGGDWFVDSAADIAKRTRIPAIVIGATVVSFATTLPELLVSVLSSVDGSTELAVGNAVGSCLCNMGLVCGISFVIMPTVMPACGKLKFYVLLLVEAFIVGLAFWGRLTLWQAIVLVVMAASFFVVNVIDAKKTQQAEDEQNKQDAETENQKPLWKTILFFVIGVAGVGGGAWLLVREATFLAGAIGISERFVGLTIVAIGTSLPELTTMIISIKKKQPHITIGNIIGSNILNLTLILGTSKLVAGGFMQVAKQTMFVTLPLMFVMSLIFILPMLIKNKTFRWQGFALLSFYVAYVVFLIVDIFVPLV